MTSPNWSDPLVDIKWSQVIVNCELFCQWPCSSPAAIYFKWSQVLINCELFCQWPCSSPAAIYFKWSHLVLVNCELLCQWPAVFLVSSRLFQSQQYYGRLCAEHDELADNSDLGGTYMLDSSVATLILDGELWYREPYTLLGHRKELRLQLEHTNMSLRELEEKSGTLRRSLAAFHFMKQRQTSGALPLLITPTVGLELSRSQQVRSFDN